MRKRLVAALLSLFLLASPSYRVLAQQSGITEPKPGSTVAGVVQIKGTAVHPQFQRYELYFSPEPVTNSSWVFIGEAHRTPVVNGVLGAWDSRSVPDGRYSLRLRVVRRDGNYDEFFSRHLLVSNTRPTATYTPEVTETPTRTPTPLPPTPTIVISVPGEATEEATPAPTSTPTRTHTAAGNSSGVTGISLKPGFSTANLKHSFVKGARLTIEIFLLVALLYVVKWALLTLFHLLVRR
jgi:hypothetical protein